MGRCPGFHSFASRYSPGSEAASLRSVLRLRALDHAPSDFRLTLVFLAHSTVAAMSRPRSHVAGRLHNVIARRTSRGQSGRIPRAPLAPARCSLQPNRRCLRLGHIRIVPGWSARIPPWGTLAEIRRVTMASRSGPRSLFVRTFCEIPSMPRRSWAKGNRSGGRPNSIKRRYRRKGAEWTEPQPQSGDPHTAALENQNPT